MLQVEYGLPLDSIDTGLDEVTDDNALSLFIEPQDQGISPFSNANPNCRIPVGRPEFFTSEMLPVSSISHGGQHFHPTQERHLSFLESTYSHTGDAQAFPLHELDMYYDSPVDIAVDETQETWFSAEDLAYHTLHQIFSFIVQQRHQNLSWEEARGLVRRIVLLTVDNVFKRHPRTSTSDALDALALVMEQVDDELTGDLVGTAGLSCKTSGRLQVQSKVNAIL